MSMSFSNMLVLAMRFGILTQSDYDAFPAYSKICALVRDRFTRMSTTYTAWAYNQKKAFDDYIKRPPKFELITINDEKEFDEQFVVTWDGKTKTEVDPEITKHERMLLDEVIDVLDEGYSEKTKKAFLKYKAFIKLLTYKLYRDASFQRVPEIEDYIESIQKDLSYIEEIDASLKRIVSINEAHAQKPVSSMSMKTRSPKLPSKMESREVVRNRIRLRPKLIAETRIDSDGNPYTVHRPDLTTPARSIENVEVRELKGTNRSHFKSYHELEAMSPLTNEVLEALPAKKRTELLYELKAFCNEMKDTITNTRFDRMRKKQLHLIVKLGPTKGQQRCYYVRTVYKMWQQAVKNNQPFKNPETGTRVTAEEKDDIMQKIRYLKPAAANPDSTARLVMDPELEFGVKQVGDLYHIRFIRRFTKQLFVIRDLGYIPSDIEVSESGSTDITSAVAVSKLQALFEKGRLMTSNFIPYRCCRISLHKTKEYWDKPMPERVQKLTKILEEIDALL